MGGSKTSAHMDGRAADFVPMDRSTTLESIVEWIRDESSLAFDQVILEFGRWVHLGIAREGAMPRREVLTITQPGRYEPYPKRKAEVA